MSNKNNVNPDHYKVAGRDRINMDLKPEYTGHDVEAENRRGRGKPAANFIPGGLPVGEAPKRSAASKKRHAPAKKRTTSRSKAKPAKSRRASTKTRARKRSASARRGHAARSTRS